MGLVYRLVPLAALVYFWLHMPAKLKGLSRTLLNGPKAMMTFMDMDAARTAIAMEYTTNERFPGDVGAFLKANINGVEKPDCDRWGMPYRLERVPEDPELVSCGPDASYATGDDMRVKVIRKKKPGEEEGSDSGDAPKLPGVDL